MKTYSFTNANGVSNYYIGINQIEIDSKEVQIKELMELIEVIQSHHEDTDLQFFNDRYVLNSEHVIHACYFVQKAFHTKNNILNKKNLELLLYLATKRQIKLSLEGFGINNYNLQNKRISFCIFSLEDNLQKVNIEINSYLHSKDISLNLENLSIDKFKIIKKYFEFSDKQILTVLKSYGYKNDVIDINPLNLESLYEVLNDLICEKMVLLSLEKRRSF